MPSSAASSPPAKPTTLGFGAKFRLVRRSGGIACALLLCLPFHYLWKLAGRKSPWPRRFLGMAGYACGMRVERIGRPLDRHVLFLANHVSWLDILLLAGASGASFVSKAEVAQWPLFGWLARLHDTVFVQRHQKRNVQGQADALRQVLAQGGAVALFPEGTTEGGHYVLPFRASLLSALFPPLPGVKVQPVAIDYGADVHHVAWVDEAAPTNVTRVISRRGTTVVRIYFLDPIDPESAGDRKILAQQARDKITALLDPSGAEVDIL